ncbi:MAG TPA: hypothetical protein VHN99_06700 [Deinococcales bacterium]|nr:hypothetical protein [Deinococcales bacterium]
MRPDRPRARTPNRAVPLGPSGLEPDGPGLPLAASPARGPGGAA